LVRLGWSEDLEKQVINHPNATAKKLIDLLLSHKSNNEEETWLCNSYGDLARRIAKEMEPGFEELHRLYNNLWRDIRPDDDQYDDSLSYHLRAEFSDMELADQIKVCRQVVAIPEAERGEADSTIYGQMFDWIQVSSRMANEFRGMAYFWSQHSPVPTDEQTTLWLDMLETLAKCDREAETKQ
jgi:hypothetical protein